MYQQVKSHLQSLYTRKASKWFVYSNLLEKRQYKNLQFRTNCFRVLAPPSSTAGADFDPDEDEPVLEARCLLTLPSIHTANYNFIVGHIFNLFTTFFCTLSNLYAFNQQSQRLTLISVLLNRFAIINKSLFRASLNLLVT